MGSTPPERGKPPDDDGTDAEDDDAAFEPQAEPHLEPSYPFPADFELEVLDSVIQVCRHPGRWHPAGTRAIVVFFPGVHGGVGPCRTPGQNFDENALFPTVARRLAERQAGSVDCYRTSWPFMRPSMRYAVTAACRVVHHALEQAVQGCSAASAEPRELRVVFVGHSRGGAVALHAAEVTARQFGPDGLGGRGMPGLENVAVRVAGICTLNGAVDVRPLLAQAAEAGGPSPLQSLSAVRALLIAGDADQVVPPEATAGLYEALPGPDKRHLVLPGATHDLYTHKEQIVEELVNFLADIGEGAQNVGSGPAR